MIFQSITLNDIIDLSLFLSLEELASIEMFIWMIM